MVYVESLVTFVDILGFRQLVASDHSGESTLRAVLRVGQFGTEDLFGYGEARRRHALRFSDSVVRVTPMPHGSGWESDREILLHELEELTYMQGELLAEGILIRGGVAAGPAYSDEAGAFGPAFIDAYLLESQHASYPRIVIHPSLTQSHGSRVGSAWSIFADDRVPLTSVASDGFHFLDYLRNFPREMHTDPPRQVKEIAESYMPDRKRLIDEQLKKHDVLSSVRAKYVWLGRYHNEVVREVLGNAGEQYLVDC